MKNSLENFSERNSELIDNDLHLDHQKSFQSLSAGLAHNAKEVRKRE